MIVQLPYLNCYYHALNTAYCDSPNEVCSSDWLARITAVTISSEESFLNRTFQYEQFRASQK